MWRGRAGWDWRWTWRTCCWRDCPCFASWGEVGGFFEARIELCSPGEQQQGRLLPAPAAPARNFRRVQPHDPACGRAANYDCQANGCAWQGRSSGQSPPTRWGSVAQVVPSVGAQYPQPAQGGQQLVASSRPSVPRASRRLVSGTSSLSQSGAALHSECLQERLRCSSSVRHSSRRAFAPSLKEQGSVVVLPVSRVLFLPLVCSLRISYLLQRPSRLLQVPSNRS